MRKKIVAANWKMNLTVKQGLSLANELANSPSVAGKNVVICPSFLHLLPLQNELKNSTIALGAQNCSNRENGAFTGEISVTMLADSQIPYVIIGHSERRIYFHESNEIIKEKINLALAFSLTPIFCCGESIAIRTDEKQNNFVEKQLEESLFHLSADEISKVIIAYEPIWAIGTGQTATKEQAQEMHSFIRKKIADKYDNTIAENCSILYGGSLTADNAKELFSQPDIDGGLVGGASLKAESFLKIIENI